MIIISELGDKTFLIAALMAMRHPRGVVFSAAFASLAIMTILSAALGHAVPHLSIGPFIPFVGCLLTG
jgi:Ca2+/H+ antiporter, TMEM165/GDT1 family